jgi:hypothetical protein
MAMSSVSVIGVLMAGWSSANKFSLIGALRAAAQLIAYELPLVLAAAAVVMLSSQTSMVGIVEAQRPLWYIVPLFPMFVVFMISALAELTRPPFDMPIADSEIIFGAYTSTGRSSRSSCWPSTAASWRSPGSRPCSSSGGIRACPTSRCRDPSGCSRRSARCRSSSSGCGPRTLGSAKISCSDSPGSP